MKLPRLLVALGCTAAVLAGSRAAQAETSPRQITELNSSWRFQQSDVVEAQNRAFDDSGWTTVSLPHCWGWEQAQKGLDYYRGPGWYRRELVVHPQASHRYFLRFGAASSVADVYLNGQPLGEHRGAFGAFCFEITGSLEASGTNTLAVRVSNAPVEDVAPLSGDFPVFGGLYRTVQLLEAGEQCLALTDHASPGVVWRQSSVTSSEAILDVTAQISNQARTPQHLNLTTKILSPEGRIICLTNKTIVSAANTIAPYWTHLSLNQPHLWNGRLDPFLYRALVELRSTNGVLLDTVEQPLGLRFYRIDPNQGFLLNGKTYPIHGVCRHQDRPDKADMAEDISLIKEIGATAVRCSHYEQSDYFYSLCDRAGILVWAEIPQIDWINKSPQFAETSRSQLLDLIRQNVNHPSIFTWGLFNEIGNRNKLDPFNQETDDPHRELQDLNGVAHSEDATRPTTCATCVGRFPQMLRIADLLGWNTYPGWYDDDADFSQFKVWLVAHRNDSSHGGFCISEYGAGANIRQHEQNPKHPIPTGQWHPEEWQAVAHEGAWTAINSQPHIWGSFIWNMFDFTSHWRHEGGTSGLNDKGLVTYDRQIRKDAFYFYKANWSDEPVLYITSRRHGERQESPTPVKVYSNARQVTLFVNGKNLGTKPVSDLKIVRWDQVRLAAGENNIKVEASFGDQKASDSCVWFLKSNSTDARSIRAEFDFAHKTVLAPSDNGSTPSANSAATISSLPP